MEAVNGYTDQELRSIEEFLLSRTVPLLCVDGGGQPVMHGTGSFYRIGDRRLLVTAAHVVQGINVANIGIRSTPASCSICIRSGSPQTTLAPRQFLRARLICCWPTARRLAAFVAASGPPRSSRG